MDPRFLTAFILFDASVLVLVFGYLIGSRKQLSLIAGLDVSKVRDRDGLARWVGGGLLSIGVLDVLVSLMMFAISVDAPVLILAYVMVNLVGAAVLLLRVRHYLS